MSMTQGSTEKRGDVRIQLKSINLKTVFISSNIKHVNNLWISEAGAADQKLFEHFSILIS